MIRFGLFRGKIPTDGLFFTKIREPLQKQLSEGIKSVPFKEDQILELKIYNRPVLRFLKGMIGLAKKNEKIKMTGTFFRVNSSETRFYNISDTFCHEELKRLENGENLLKEKNSFVFRLVERINQAISE